MITKKKDNMPDQPFSDDEIDMEKARFERWAKEQGFHLSQSIHRDYENSKLNWMWFAWQEAVRR